MGSVGTRGLTEHDFVLDQCSTVFKKCRPSEAKGLFPRRHSAVDKKSTTLERRKNLFKTQQRRRKKKLEPFFSKLKVFVFKKDFFETSEKKKSLAIDFQFFFLPAPKKKSGSASVSVSVPEKPGNLLLRYNSETRPDGIKVSLATFRKSHRRTER